MKRNESGLLLAAVSTVLFALFPQGAHALHVTEPALGNKCYDCHSLKTNEGQANTSYINSSAQTLPTIRSLLGIGASDPAPDMLGCTFCHNSTITYITDALSHFSSKTSSHPVGTDFTTGLPATDNNYFSTIGSVTPNQLDCVDCHDPALVSYPSHAAAPAENPFRLRGVTVAGEYDNLCRLCHANGAVIPGKGNDVGLVAGVDHEDGSAGVIEEDDGTVMRTGETGLPDGVDDGLGDQCTACHDTHYSNLVKLLNDGHEGDTAVSGSNCTELCHYAGDHDDSYNTRGHGKASSTYKYRLGSPDGTGWNIDMGLACTSCHISLDTTDVTAGRKPHVEYPDTGVKWDDYENRFNLNRNVQSWDPGSDFGNPEWGVCFDCHGSNDTHSGNDGEIIGCQDCHDEHAEGSEAASNVFMIPGVSNPGGNYTVPPPAAKAGAEAVLYTRPRLDVSDTVPPEQEPYGDGAQEYYRADGEGVCDNTECHGTTTTATIPGPLEELMTGDSHSGGDLGPGYDCGECHTHSGDPDGAFRASSGGAAALAVAAVDHDALRVAGRSDALVAGDTMTVSAEGSPGQKAIFDVVPLADRRGEIALDWKGWGVYLEEITFFEDDQVDLRDVEEYRVYASTGPLGEITLETAPVETLEVETQGVVLGGLEFETPHYVAVMALMDDDSLLPVIEPVENVVMSEVEGAPGTYEGTYAIGYRDRYPEAVVVTRIGEGEEEAVKVGEEVFAIDPSLDIAVVSSVEELKADEESTAEIEVTVTDANGRPVSDHEVRFLLVTTSQYTGVVGGGSFAAEVGGSLSRDFWGETDLFGQVTATYTAGFAAKTAIIVARDMMSNDVGAGYVKTYIEAAAELELEAVQEVAGKALGYTIAVTSSEEWLTADGESEARITALVARNGIPVDGHRVSFRVSSGTGSIRTVDGETGRDGKARAVYTAGKKIGVVLITATDQTVGISGSVQVELRSDAPAKIALTLTPDLLPADGRSTADVEVVVTDINDNPNEGVEVEYEVEIGSGRLRRIEGLTDRGGESTAEYVAGVVPGMVSIKVTVRSAVPTEEEMAAARALATAVTDYDFF